MPDTPQSSLVLFGRRRALERAAAARGLAIAVGEVPPDARRVVDLSERHVLAAARARARAGLPGLTVEQALTFRDKLAMKRAFRALSVPCTPFAAAPAWWPVVVKPRFGSSGRGRLIATEPRVARAHVAANRARFPGGFIYEPLVRAREISIETFVSRGQVVFQSTTDYLVYGAVSRVPAVLDEATRRRALDLAARATLGLGLTGGVSHAELWITERGPMLSEIACRPPGGNLFDLIGRAHDLDPWELFLKCVLDEDVEHPGPARRWAGNVLLHPAPGRIAGVRGLARARALPGVVRLRHRLGPGVVVPPRASLGQIAGVLTVEHADPAVVQRTLREAAALVRFRYDQ